LKTLYLQYTNPAGYPPLEPSSRILANEGWQVLFLPQARKVRMRWNSRRIQTWKFANCNFVRQVGGSAPGFPHAPCGCARNWGRRWTGRIA
jgi:hypothetical protein